MTRDEILSTPSVPVFGPSYPRGPYRFVRREYLIVIYETDRDALRRALPEPLEPHPENIVFYEWMKMPDSSGFGDCQESGSGAHAIYDGQSCNFSVQMYFNDEPPITAGREIWGFPKKWGQPSLSLRKDTLTGTLHYDDERVAMGTMTYKLKSLDGEISRMSEGLEKLNINLKLFLDVDGSPKIAQFVGYGLEDVKVHGAWECEARLELSPHVNCRVADLPVHRIVGGRHMVVDSTLPFARVLHDYLA